MKAIWKSIYIMMAGILPLMADASGLNEKAVESWVSTNRFFSAIHLQVSRNYFLPEDDPNFTIAPGEMTTVDGALLPESFYVKYDEQAYREKIIQGQTTTNCWAIDVGRKMLMTGSKDPALGGVCTNWTRIATDKQQQRLRDFTQFGLLYVRPGSLQIHGTNFTAISSMTSDESKIKGEFCALDSSGIPHSFEYSFTDGPSFRIAGTFRQVNSASGKFDCTDSFWINNKLAKQIRITTPLGLIAASDSDLGKIFQPNEFIDPQITLVESNHLRYQLLPSGRLQRYSPSRPQAPTTNALVVVLIALVSVTAIFLYVAVSRILKAF